MLLYNFDFRQRHLATYVVQCACIVHGHVFLCFYAKAARMKVAAGDLEDERVTRRVEGGITKILLLRRMGTEHFAVTRKARRSTRTFVACIYHLLRLLRRSSSHLYLVINIFVLSHLCVQCIPEFYFFPYLRYLKILIANKKKKHETNQKYILYRETIEMHEFVKC